jgi:hypothetical protein
LHFFPAIFCWLGLFFSRLFSTEFNSHGHYQIPRKADPLTCYYKYRTTGTKLGWNIDNAGIADMNNHEVYTSS